MTRRVGTQCLPDPGSRRRRGVGRPAPHSVDDVYLVSLSAARPGGMRMATACAMWSADTARGARGGALHPLLNR